ncbi:MAG: NAD-dependent epimerase/dehydratase family protein [Candidatus Diapherotrites archaeon]
MNKQNVLVTGGAGFIGSHLCDALKKEGHAVFALDNLFLGKKENIGKGIEFINADATDLKKMERIIEEKEIETVFDLATIPLPASLEKPEWCFDEIMKISLVLCELARKDEFNLLIHYSSSEAFGTALGNAMNESHALKPHTVYASAKAAQDLLIESYHKTYGIEYLIVRPFNNYGPRQNEGNYAGIIPITIKRILQGKKPVIFGSGSQTRDFLYAGDTAEGTVKLFNEPKARNISVNLCSGKEISVKEVIDAICREMHYGGGIDFLPERAGDVKRHLGDCSLAEKLVGFKPTVSFEEGIKKTIEWYNKGKA